MTEIIWFWQRMITPHMAHLAQALALRGHDVTFVAEEPMSSERAAMGWSVPAIQHNVTILIVPDATSVRTAVRIAPMESIHLTQGLRANGVVSFAQRAIRERKLRHFAMMETVDLRGIRGKVKVGLYAWNLWCWHRDLEGVLAIGAETPGWLSRIAPTGIRIVPFAYFLPVPVQSGKSLAEDDFEFRFLFVGSLIPLKRVGLLLRALAKLGNASFVVDIIGDGPLRRELELMADSVLPGRVRFHGILPISKVSDCMVSADCLVLPSIHDGWGAVISEALLVGTPVVCSSACGAKEIVAASGSGGVFNKDEPDELIVLLKKALAQGKVNPSIRFQLRQWAHCVGAEAGAEYLEQLLTIKSVDSLTAPWRQSKYQSQ